MDWDKKIFYRGRDAQEEFFFYFFYFKIILYWFFFGDGDEFMKIMRIMID